MIFRQVLRVNIYSSNNYLVSSLDVIQPRDYVRGIYFRYCALNEIKLITVIITHKHIPPQKISCEGISIYFTVVSLLWLVVECAIKHSNNYFSLAFDFGRIVIFTIFRT